MSEPTLQQISDYDTLSGQKRRVVLAVILSGLIIGAAYSAAEVFYGEPSDTIAVKHTIASVPFK